LSFRFRYLFIVLEDGKESVTGVQKIGSSGKCKNTDKLPATIPLPLAFPPIHILFPSNVNLANCMLPDQAAYYNNTIPCR
jgi:hypothetical protein